MKNGNQSLPRPHLGLVRSAIAGLALFCLSGSIAVAENAAPAGGQTMTEKLNSIILPEIVFEKTPLKDAIATLMRRSAELDPEKKGVALMLVGDTPKIGDAIISLKLTNVTLKDAVDAICQVAGLESRISPFALILKAK